MFPNLIYHRNMIDKSLISTDNLISQQQQQQLNNTKSEKNNNTNKKKIEIVPLIQRPEQEKQKTESSLFQLNSNLLNHLFLTSTATTSTTFLIHSHCKPQQTVHWYKIRRCNFIQILPLTIIGVLNCRKLIMYLHLML